MWPLHPQDKKKIHFESVWHGPILYLKHTLLFSYSAAASAQAIFKVELISKKKNK